MLKPIIILLVVSIAIVSSSASSQNSSSRLPYRANFRTCCALGRQTANSTHDSCNDYSKLIDNTGSCRYAFTICCNQNRRENECEKGKRHAYSGKSCGELNKTSNCDALSVNLLIKF